MSPTWTARESANWSGFTPFGTEFAPMSTTAMSLDGSEPITLPSSEVVSCPKRTSTRLFEPTTCEFVTSRPLESIRKPVPEPELVRIETTAGLASA